MSIYKQKNGKWRSEPYCGNRRLPTKTFLTKALAERYERQILQEFEERAITGSNAKDYKYDELLDFWLEEARIRKAPTSLVKDLQMHRDYIQPVIGQLRISQISVSELNKISQLVLKKELSKASLNKVIQHFKAVFNYSSNNGLILRNPSKAVKQVKLDFKLREAFSSEELNQLLSYTNRKYRGEDRWKHTFCLTLLLTGQRLGEVLGMQWSQVRFKEDQILINQQWCSKTNMILKTTKGKKDVVIPLNRFLKEELSSLRNQNKGEFIFSFDGSRPADASNCRRRWYNDLEEAGLRRLNPHGCRHTYASLLLENGATIYQVKEVLNHASVKTTEIYSHMSKKHLAGIKDLIKPDIAIPSEVISIGNRDPRRIHAQDAEDRLLTLNGGSLRSNSLK